MTFVGRVFSTTLALASLACSAGPSVADGWTYFEPHRRSKVSTYEVDGGGKYGPLSVVCENFELSVLAKVPEASVDRKQPRFTLQSGPKLATLLGTLIQGPEGYFVSTKLGFQDPIFAMIEAGNLTVKDSGGNVLGQIKAANPNLKTLVFDCRK